MQTSDTEYVEVTYNHRNKGQHPVHGGATGTFYGYRAGGDKLLVHTNDQKAQPTLFIPVPAAATQPKINYQEPKKATPPPQSIKPVEPVAIKPVAVEAEEELDKENLLDSNVANVYKPLDLQTIPGITPAVARQLSYNGLETKEAIMKAGKEGLLQVKGVAEGRANAILEYLANLD